MTAFFQTERFKLSKHRLFIFNLIDWVLSFLNKNLNIAVKGFSTIKGSDIVIHSSNLYFINIINFLSKTSI
jgi:hypothetical protein